MTKSRGIRVRAEKSVGLKYNKLTVLSVYRVLTKGNLYRTRCVCRCDCGTKSHDSLLDLVKRGQIKSCGCARKDFRDKRASERGCPPRKSKEYRTWAEMKTRCYNKNRLGYQHYGARGIAVCDRWINSFPRFFEDMGYAPNSDYSIERVDPNGNYCPENCKWIPLREQARNRRTSRKFQVGGKELLLKDLADLCCVHSSTVSSYIARYGLENGLSKLKERFCGA